MNIVIVLYALIHNCKAAETCVDARSDVASVAPSTKIRFERLPTEVFASVGSFLSCPQRRLSLVDKRMNKLFTEKYPFGRILAERLDIPGLRGLSLKNSELLLLNRWFKGPIDWKLEFPKMIMFCLDRKLTELEVGDFVLFAFDKLVGQIDDHQALETFMTQKSLEEQGKKLLIVDLCKLAARIRHEGLINKTLETLFSTADDGNLNRKQKITRRILDKIAMPGSADFDILRFYSYRSMSFHWVEALLHLLCDAKGSDKMDHVFAPKLIYSVIYDIDDPSSLTEAEKLQIRTMGDAFGTFKLDSENMYVGYILSIFILFSERDFETQLIEIFSESLTRVIRFDFFELLIKKLLKRGTFHRLFRDKKMAGTFSDPELIEMVLADEQAYQLLKRFLPDNVKSAAEQFEAIANLEIVIRYFGVSSVSEVLCLETVLLLKAKYAIKFGSGPEALDLVLDMSTQNTLTLKDCDEVFAFIIKEHSRSLQLCNWIRVFVLKHQNRPESSVDVDEFNSEAILEVLTDKDLIEANIMKKLYFHCEIRNKIILAAIRNEKYYKLSTDGSKILRNFQDYNSGAFEALIVACRTEAEIEKLFEVTDARKFYFLERVLKHSKPERIESLRVMLSFWSKTYPEQFYSDDSRRSWYYLMNPHLDPASDDSFGILKALHKLSPPRK